MYIPPKLKQRFNAAGLFTTTQLAEATGLTTVRVIELARSPGVRLQKVGKMTFIDARTFALVLTEAPLLRTAVATLIKQHTPGVPAKA